MKQVEIILMVKTENAVRGEGIEGDPIRIITQYWDMEGNLVFEIDPIKKDKE